MLQRWRDSSVGRYTSCKKLVIDRLIGVKGEKIISGHSLLDQTVLTSKWFLRDTQTDKAYERKEYVRATLPYCSQHDTASSLARLVPLVTSGRLILDS